MGLDLTVYLPSGSSEHIYWWDTYRVITSGYIGIGTGKASADFDDLVIVVINSPYPSGNSPDPRYIKVSNLLPGWKVEVRDSSWNLIGSATADSSGVAKVLIVKKPIINNGYIVVYNEKGEEVFRKQFSKIVGGDYYKVTGYKLVSLEVKTSVEKSSSADYKALIKVDADQSIGASIYAFDWSKSSYSLIYSGNTPIDETIDLEEKYVNDNGEVLLKLVETTSSRTIVQVDALNVKVISPEFVTKAVICSGNAETPTCELYTWNNSEDPGGVFLLLSNGGNTFKYYFWAEDRTENPTATGTISVSLGF